MKKYSTIICLLIITLVTFSKVNAQLDVSNAIIYQDFPFHTTVENGKTIELEPNIIRRSRSFGNTENVADIFYHEIYEKDLETEEIKPIYGGEISEFEMSREKVNLFGKDIEILSLVKMTYVWEAVHFETGEEKKFKVIEYYYVNNESFNILKIEKLMHQGIEFYGWGDHIEPSADNLLDVEDIAFFKIKRIAIDAGTTVNLENPEKFIKYAFLTRKGFYRFNNPKHKDSIIFTGKPKIENSTEYTKLATYETTNQEFDLIYNYDMNDVTQFVSMLDFKPFPQLIVENKESDSPIVIVWKKANIVDEWVNLSLKYFKISNMGFTKKELDIIKTKLDIIEEVIKIINNTPE